MSGNKRAASEKVYAIASAYDHPELIPHFLDHYARLGVRRTIIVCRKAGVYDHAVQYAKGYPACVVYVPAGRFATMDKEAVQLSVLNSQSLQPDDYVMHLDLDEFQEYPAPLPTVVAEMNRHDAWAVRGHFVDRVAADGRLKRLAASPSVFEQFPLEAQVTRVICGGWTQKIMLCRARVRLRGGGHHDTQNARYGRPPLGESRQYKVHHFKWLAGLAERLKRRLREGGTGEAYQRECRRFLVYYRRHGRIRLETPALQARHAGAFRY